MTTSTTTVTATQRTLRIPTNGIHLQAVLQGAGPLVLMVHGFPEGWFSWRHQLPAIAAAGYTACAIDVRGYGGSDKPAAIDAYAMEQISADVAGVVQHLQPGVPAVLIGHDWGAPIVWNTALAHPHAVRAVAGLSVPWTGVARHNFLDLVRAAYTDRGLFFYQVYFQDEGVAEAELQADVRATLKRFYFAISGDAPKGAWPKDKPHGAPLLQDLIDPDPFPAWLSEAELQHFVDAFTASGFRGPLNRYRNHAADFAWQQQFTGRKISQPSLFIGGDRDPVLRMLPGSTPAELPALLARHLSGLRGVHVLPGIGHWTQQQEAPEAVTQRLLHWLREV